MSTRTSPRSLVAGLAGAAVALSGLAVVSSAAPAQANPDGTGLVISEVYGGGGNSGAPFTHDFIEIYNPTDAPISVDGWSVQGRSAGNTSVATAQNTTELAGAVPAGGYYLVQEAAGSGNGVPLPTPDATGGMGMGASGWQVWLANTATPLDPVDGDVTAGTPDPAIIDLVGAATNSASFEAVTANEAPSNTLSTQRDASNVDTDNNADDFSTAAPTPGGPAETPPDPVEVTIAEIQGDGAVSPLLGDPVITEGVVTAAYPAGGFFGFYMQTEGTGGSVDPDARTTSDGIFVRQTFDAGPVTVDVGDFVQVSGNVTEFAGQTQVEVADPADIVDAVGTPAPVTPVTTTSWPDTDAEKEALEGMLYSPEGDFTVTNTFGTNTFGEVGLAVGNTPLIQPTEVADAQDGPAVDAVVADNAARAIVLDDASTTNFNANSFSTGTCGPRPVPCLLNGDLTPPYISNDDPVRVGASTTFTDDVILSEGGSPSSPTYRFQPVQTVVGPANAESPATFANTRTAAPDEAAINGEGSAELKLASFNVLNYFTTLGDPDDDNVGDGGCLAYYDRDDDGNNNRTGCDPRGAWDPQDLSRQQEKIVAAINSLDADVVGLMEIENSARLGETADEATETLVAALNADAGSDVWAANPSSADLPPAGEQDVITNAIIYKPASVERTGDARALGDQSGDGEPFSNAREPIGQAFTPTGGGDPFLVVVNHFKSKGSGDDDGTGQGNANPDRVAQAEALRDWVPGVEVDLGVNATFLIGDFNAYTMEDPMQVFYDAGYEDVAPDGEYSYSFSGLSGSLDHVVADAEALAMVTGSDIWNINSGESVALEYSRWNYHSTDFHDSGPYRSSDHDPLVVGIDVAGDEAVETTVEATGGPVVYGTGWSAAATVTPDSATGTVEVSIGGTKLGEATLSDGAASVPVSGTALEPGSHVLTVEYLGDANHESSINTFTVIVAPPAPGQTVTTVSVPPMTYGTAASATIKVTSALPVSGTVELYEGETLIGSDSVSTDGNATIVIPGTALSVGSHTLTAKYLGDEANGASEGTTQVQIAKAASTTQVGVKPAVAEAGKDKVTLAAKVTAEGFTPTGDVVFSVNGVDLPAVPLVDGVAAVTGGPLNVVGTFEVTATYLGDDTTETSTSEPVTLRMVKATPRLKVKVRPGRVIVDKTKAKVISVVKVGGKAATGKVKVKVGGKTYRAKLDNGRAMIRLQPFGKIGKKKAKVVYLGNAITKRAVKTVTIRVVRR